MKIAPRGSTLSHPEYIRNSPTSQFEIFIFNNKYFSERSVKRKKKSKLIIIVEIATTLKICSRVIPTSEIQIRGWGGGCKVHNMKDWSNGFPMLYHMRRSVKVSKLPPPFPVGSLSRKNVMTNNISHSIKTYIFLFKLSLWWLFIKLLHINI